MADKEWLEIPVFIHGITEKKKPGSKNKSSNSVPFQKKLFDTLLKNVIEYFKEGNPFEDVMMVYWGFEKSDADDETLAEAERVVGKMVFESAKKICDFTINPLRLALKPMREIAIFGVSDLFYYISEDGERAVRNNIFDKLSQAIIDAEKESKSPKENISLTIFAHSAGSIIAHDFLFNLFRDYDSNYDKVNEARALDKEGRLRVRRLFTFGSPLVLSIFRKQKLIDIVLNHKKIGVEELGFSPDDDFSLPRWVNYWDKDDFCAYPVEFLYETFYGEKVVEDKYIDVSDYISKVHERYFYNKKMAEHMAEVW